MQALYKKTIFLIWFKKIAGRQRLMKPIASTAKSMKFFPNSSVINIISHRLEQLPTFSTATYAVLENTIASSVVLEGQMFTARCWYHCVMSRVGSRTLNSDTAGMQGQPSNVGLRPLFYIIVERSIPRPWGDLFFSLEWNKESYQKPIHSSEITGQGRAETLYNWNTWYQKNLILFWFLVCFLNLILYLRQFN